MSEILEHGHETSVYINSDQSRYIGEMGWRNLNFPDVLERALRRAVKVKNLKKTKRKFDDGEISLGELLNELDSL